MKIQRKLLTALVLLLINAFHYAQGNFKEFPLALMEEVATNSSFNTIKSLMSEKGYSYVDENEDKEVTMYLFKDTQNKTKIITGYSPARKLYNIVVFTDDDLSSTEKELETQRGFIRSEETEKTTAWKKSGYPYRFIFPKQKKDWAVKLITEEYDFNSVKDSDRLITVNHLKELIGNDSSSNTRTLKSKKYYYEYDYTIRFGMDEVLFFGKGADWLYVIYKDKVAEAAGLAGLNVSEYQQLLNWLNKNGYSLKQKGGAVADTPDIWESSDGNWKLVIDYGESADVPPRKIMLYRKTADGFVFEKK